MANEPDFGNVCRDEAGRLGVVNRYQGTGFRKWYGIGFDGRPWSSSRPSIVAITVDDYIKRANEQSIFSKTG